MNSIEVSIIVPVYQVESYIEECLKSIMGQTYTGSIECILIDDCGTDNSILIAQNMIAAYKGPLYFKIIRHERNRGLSAARNTGTEYASGEWIFYLDSDDVITKDCIKLMMEKVNEYPEVELVQGKVKTYPVKNADGLSVHVSHPIATSNNEVRKCFFDLEQLNVAPWNKLIKRSFLKEHNIQFEDGLIFEDTPWTFKMLKHLTIVSFVDVYTYYYKRRADSIVTGTSSIKKASDLRKSYHHILSNLTPNHERVEIGYYGKKFAYFYARFSTIVQEYSDDMVAWNEAAKKYGGIDVRLWLYVGRIMGRIRYGWLVLSLMYRFEHLRGVSTDIQRVWLLLKK
jgi:glycosyltransferase involved in cell wall biosynthesis